MDAMGVDQALLYPTWFAEGFFLVRDPDVAYALARAYNDWVIDFCKAAPDRLLAAAILPLQNMDFALEELTRVTGVPSVRAVFIRPMFLEDRYLNHPYYDPLWAELERRGIAAAVHATPGLWNPEWTSHGPFFEKVKDRMAQPPVPGGGGGPFAGGSGGAGQSITFIGATPLGHPLAPVLANWLDNHMFVASTLIGFTVMERYPAMKVVVAHGKASWMQEVLEKMEASTRVIPLLHHYPVSTEPEEVWEHGNVMLGFDAEERLIQKLPQDFASKVVWGSRYPHHDATSAWDALARLRAANVPEPLIARMMGSNAARQFAGRAASETGSVSSSRLIHRGDQFADSPLEGTCVDALRGSRALWLGIVLPVAGLCPACSRGQWPLALMDCPPPEAPIWISRLMRIPSQRVCFGSRSD
jgi:predicted TIM-barrel fold metal-dependent hydrolase